MKDSGVRLQLVNFKQGKMLKKLGFEPSVTQSPQAYDELGRFVNWTTKQFHCWAPPLALAINWLRDKKRIVIQPTNSLDKNKRQGYYPTVTFIHNKNKKWKNRSPVNFAAYTKSTYREKHYKKFETAESAGLTKVLEYLCSLK